MVYEQVLQKKDAVLHEVMNALGAKKEEVIIYFTINS